MVVSRGKYQLVVAEKGWKTLKQNLKTNTRKTTACSLEERIRRLLEVQIGWINYYRMCSMYGKLKDHDSWLRNRLRYCIWKDWKKPERKRKNLIRLGTPPGQAFAFSRIRMGGWAVAQSPILLTTITLKRLQKRGYESLLDYYYKVAPQFNEPSRLRRGGVRGSPCVILRRAAYSIMGMCFTCLKVSCWQHHLIMNVIPKDAFILWKV